MSQGEVMTRDALGLPWRMEGHERGYEINCSPAGWLFRVVLEDTIGKHSRDEDPEFRSAQDAHAGFILAAANAHHDLLEVLERAAKQFESYARDHSAKANAATARNALGDADIAMSKARTNTAHAEMCRAAIEKATKP